MGVFERKELKKITEPKIISKNDIRSWMSNEIEEWIEFGDKLRVCKVQRIRGHRQITSRKK